MYFIIFVMSWYVSIWLGKHSFNLANSMNIHGKPVSQGLWGILVNAIKGFNVGYTLWFIWYCITTYTNLF